ncbi:MAG: signal recognition particle-docking protein FtsY [Candidatus Micrarchaeota archaeon]|nr:signal recognition particle-docking protein FtsY [Candidatus Micrarchaeota archaeon]
MFDLLKKKISSFVDAIVRKEEAKEKEAEKAAVEPAETAEEKPVQAPVPREEKKARPAEKAKEPAAAPEAKKPPAAKAEDRLKPKTSVFGKVKAFITGEITINEKELSGLLNELEIALLESDVSYEAAGYVREQLGKRLAGKKMAVGEVGARVRKEVADVIEGVFPEQGGLFAMAAEKKAGGKPFVILFVGPNGMGKTTTIAKIAQLFKEKGFSSVIAAGDTFRAAAIPQIKEHGERLGIPVIAHAPGSDPTSVAFDAVSFAKARGIDCVLVDTAGRQETNYNLVKEMEKMNRVLKPDYRIFIAEAVAGHSLAEQVKQFDKAAGGVDGIVLTKTDCDAKGGGAVGIAYETKKPVLFIGTGQGYGDLKEFDRKWFAKNIAGVAE